MKFMLMGGVCALALAACTTPDTTLVCDRESQEWNKWGTSELAPVCSPRPMPRPTVLEVNGEDDADGHADRGGRNGGDQSDSGDDAAGGDSPSDGGSQDDGPGSDGGSDGSDDGGSDGSDSDGSSGTPSGNPGNHRDVGKAGESPNGRDFGSGDRGVSR